MNYEIQQPLTSPASFAFWKDGQPVPIVPMTPQEPPKQILKAAIKADQGKTDWCILPIKPSEEIIKVFSFGEQKYARGNYQEGGGLKYSRVINSLLRHIHAFMQGEDKDPESGLHHLAHAGCNIYMLLSYELNQEPGRYDNDDREDSIVK